ncbi:hypothetical protein [Peribacillus sp. Hz7]|uniref:hypothetical protein n=1 Tax=Peribacillus sp. Hz7 TaxID=3344873 RepID=UPI0035CAE514
MVSFTYEINPKYKGDKMLIVKTKEQLKQAKENKVKEFTVVGDLAEKLYKAQKISKLSKKAAVALAGAVGVGAAAAPFTAGTSFGITAFATTAAASAVGTGTIIAAISVGGVLLVYTIYQGYSFKIVKTKDGIEIEFTSKHHSK